MKKIILFGVLLLTLTLNGCTEQISYEKAFESKVVRTEYEVVTTDSIVIEGLGTVFIPDDFVCYNSGDTLYIFNRNNSAQVILHNTTITQSIQDVELDYGFEYGVESNDIKDIVATKYEEDSETYYIFTNNSGEYIILGTYYVDDSAKEMVEEIIMNYKR